MHHLFRLDKILDGRKSFKYEKVGMMTNAVKASVLYITPRPPVPDPVEVDEDESLLHSIQQLSLTPPDGENDSIDDHINDVDIAEEETVVEENIEDNGSVGSEEETVVVEENDEDN